MKISIGNDHAGTEYKFEILKYLESQGNTVYNHGTDLKDSADYPDFVHPVARDVEDNKADFGITICGSGNGASMTANKYKGIRSALCWTKEIASLAREHNNANILAMGARVIGDEVAKQITEVFLTTDFKSDHANHPRRVEKILKLEEDS